MAYISWYINPLQVERLEEALHELNFEYQNLQSREENLTQTVSIKWGIFLESEGCDAATRFFRKVNFCFTSGPFKILEINSSMSLTIMVVLKLITKSYQFKFG